MNELQVIDNKKIENYIYEIRGKQVMLDSDLAFLYECKNLISVFLNLAISSIRNVVSLSLFNESIKFNIS